MSFKLYIILKQFKSTLNIKFNLNNKLIDALNEYTYYSNNIELNKDFTNDIINLQNINIQINRLIKDINHKEIIIPQFPFS
tara:strand:+ start:703 stop:945 length:243 start_codon:yes stop_codon:yes gene_type:complete